MRNPHSTHFASVQHRWHTASDLGCGRVPLKKRSKDLLFFVETLDVHIKAKAPTCGSHESLARATRFITTNKNIDKMVQRSAKILKVRAAAKVRNPQGYGCKFC